VFALTGSSKPVAKNTPPKTPLEHSEESPAKNGVPKESPATSGGANNTTTKTTTPDKPIESRPTETPSKPTSTARSMPACIDNSDPEFKTQGGGWNVNSEKGYKNNLVYHHGDGQPATFTWTFDGLENGKSYMVFASWLADDKHTDGANYYFVGTEG